MAQYAAKRPSSVKPETYIGGALALITLVAAVLRYVLSPQSPSDVLTMIISITSPLLTLVVLLAAIRSLRALFEKADDSFGTVLDRELEDWLDRMKPLVRVKNAYTGDGDTDGATYEMIVEQDSILKRGENLDHKRYVDFLKLPDSFAKDQKVLFLLRESMFAHRAEARHQDRTVVTELLAKDFAATIGQGFDDLVAAHAHPDSGIADRVTLTLQHDLTTSADAHRLIHLINYSTLLYLASA